ncbi:MAG: hypothetical protein ABI946_07750, partial [Chthoniobacterales bacterium]
MSTVSAVLEDVMEVELPQDKSAPALLSGMPEGLGRDLPDWFLSRQEEAWKQFQALPMPARKDQPWRFSNVGALALEPFVLAVPPNDEARDDILERSRAFAQGAGRLVFADDSFLRLDPLPEALIKQGVILQPLERGLIEHEELFRKHFMAQPTPLG